ncbi:glycoside hydrolase family 97 catalytic domain-containing protein [Leifsonia shinshuensis]|uniref:Alpha-glucosidase n=1 Tax=Leifsonia shinshuensis TaxID=150026 RepID=A0A853CSX1_9MICO|nr:glycoside hydrolase family 97 catalytic domain-containing protein [Leifsonia shinshuensis]NYJ21950.1 alpha-glucosidase [Leifsonia shinshuensis]
MHLRALSRPLRLPAAALVVGALVATTTAASADDPSAAQRLSVESVDGRVSATLNTGPDGTLDLTTSLDGRPVLQPVRLGIVTEAADLTTGLTFERSERRRIQSSYAPGGAEKGTVSSVMDELVAVYRKGTAGLTVAVRATPSGVAFRYTADLPGSSAVVAEATAFELLAGSTVWASPYERNYEGKPQRFGPTELGGNRLSMPALVSAPDGRWVQLTEAAVRAGGGPYPAVRLDAPRGKGQALRVALPGPDNAVFDESPASVRVPFDGSLTTPWRVIGMGSGLDALVESHLLTDLNAPPAPELTGSAANWIRPGVSLWPWWSNSMASGDDYLALHRQYVDAAERLGLPYVTADAGYSSWDQLEELADYAKARGVGIFAWMHRNEFRRADKTLFDQSEIDSAMKKLAERGVVGLKIDFFDSDRADIMRFYDRLSIGAGRAKLMLDFHGSTKPGGEQRTYPHVLTSEGVAGAEGYKNGNPASARDNVNLTLGRGLLGSADATPVALSLANPLTTQAHQLALSVAFTSALTTLADTPAAYETWPGVDVLRSLPTVWDQSLLVDAAPDSHAAFARRSGQDWYVGAITDGARQLPVPLDFLGSGTYTATVYRDGGANGQPLVERSAVTSADTLTLPLAEHGGAMVVLTPGHPAPTPKADRILEAESAAMGGSARVAPCASCSGGAKAGYVGYAGITFSDVEAEGAYTARIAYLSGEKRRLTVTVDGVASPPVTPAESGRGSGDPNGWNVPRTIDVPLHFAPGKHTIVLSGTDGNAPDLDRVELIRTYQAEDAANVLTGRATRAPCAAAGCSGEMVGQLGYGASVTFTGVTAMKAGATTVGIRYASAQVRSIVVRVNGGPERVVTFPRTASWDDWSLRTISVDLVEGLNSITLAAEASGWAPDIDAIDVAQ